MNYLAIHIPDFVLLLSSKRLVLNVHDRQATETVWMSHADCVRVAKGVFLDTATLYFRDLIDTVEGQARGKTEGGVTT